MFHGAILPGGRSGGGGPSGALHESLTAGLRARLGKTPVTGIRDIAARQSGARGENAQIISMPNTGLLRFPGAPVPARFEASLHGPELTARIGDDSREDLASADASLASHGLADDARQQLVRAREELGSSPGAIAGTVVPAGRADGDR